MMENKMAWQEGYEAGYAAAQEELDKLAAERDALLADVKDYQGSICCYCKHIVRDNEKKKVYCGCFGDFPTSDGMPLMCGRFEWRGLSLATETSDKEVE